MVAEIIQFEGNDRIKIAQHWLSKNSVDHDVRVQCKRECDRRAGEVPDDSGGEVTMAGIIKIRV
jgi:hypothetical protein